MLLFLMGDYYCPLNNNTFNLEMTKNNVFLKKMIKSEKGRIV